MSQIRNKQLTIDGYVYQMHWMPRVANVRELGNFYLSSPSGIIGFNRVKTGEDNIYYTLKDHLGSIMVVASETGTKLEEYSYDAWGRRRNVGDWTYSNISAPTYITRGYTGHEHIEEVGLINMNGRVYDPLVGLFLSPDPVVQSPGNALNYNRYSYAFNNPLKYTDPSGYLISKEQGQADYLTRRGFVGFNDGRQVAWDCVYNFYERQATLAQGLSSFDRVVGSAGNIFRSTDALYRWFGGVYLNRASEVVSFDEVFNNYILPNAERSISNDGSKETKDYFGVVLTGLKYSNGFSESAAFMMYSFNKNSITMAIYDFVSPTDPIKVATNSGDGYLSEYVKSNFGNELQQLDGNVTWILDKDELHTGAKGEKFIYGATGPANGDWGLAGNAVVYIHPSLLNDQTHLYLTVGHELAHAYHLTNGWYAGWRSNYGQKMARVISEYHAYDFSSNLEIRLNVDYGHLDGFVKYYNLLPSGYGN